MSYLANGFIAIWIVGILVLAGVYLNDIRRILNNLVSGASLAGHLWTASLRKHSLINVDPALLNETGRAYVKKAIRNQRIALVWGLGGFLITSCIDYYMKR